MARRRKITGKRLLVASSAVAMGCGIGAVSGNLVAPPTYELCITVDPDTAAVTVDGTGLDELDGGKTDGCIDTWGGTHEIAATAEGYVDHSEQVDILEDTAIDIVLDPETGM